jgi:hypothetical protein
VSDPPLLELQDDIVVIPDSARLFRRIVPKFVKWVGVSDQDKPPVPSQGFQDYPADIARENFGLPGSCMSVALAEVLSKHGFDASKVIEDFPGYGIATFTAGAMRTLSGPAGVDWTQGVMLNPTDAEPWHAVVFCNNGGRKTNGIQTAIRVVASWVAAPVRPTDG